jgi:hypothetical protein
MADPQNTTEDIIELTELIEKGDKSVPADSETVNKAAMKAKEEATGTALESLNDASAASPEGDIDSLLAQMDAGDKNETMAQPASQTEISTDVLTTDATGHLVDPHEKLDMSGMEEVDNLLSSLQIPLTPPQTEDTSREDAVSAQEAAPPPADNAPFDLDSLLSPVNGMNSPLEGVDSLIWEEPGGEPPAPPLDSPPYPPAPAADTKTPEKTQTEVRDLSAELDDILAAADEPDLPEESSPQPPPEKKETPSEAVEELPASRPSQEIQPAEELSGPDEKLLRSDSLPSGGDATAKHALPVEKKPVPSQDPTECMPEAIQDTEQDTTEAVAPEAAMTETPTEEVRESPSLSADRLPEIENRMDALEKSLAEITAQESPSRLADRLLEVEHRLDALERGLPEVAGASDLEALEQRLTALESATIPLKEERPAPVEENAQALHAYMELAARLDGTETRLNALAELAARVDDMETRLSSVTEQFETRVEKAAAAAAAKLLREEIAGLLAS